MIEGTLWPRTFEQRNAPGSDDPAPRDAEFDKLIAFFKAKGPAALRAEDDGEVWYQDWIDYQAAHGLYASLLSPAKYSTLGNRFDLLRLVRFIEAFAYFSPSHGYSLQVSFLGLSAILMGANEPLKREAVAALEAGGLFALGVSEKDHGSDLLGNEFALVATPRDGAASRGFTANGRKYYIGNANCAAMVSVLARVVHDDGRDVAALRHRTSLALVAVRPATSPGYRPARKIRTSGVRSAFVGEIEVVGQPLPADDFIAEGRGAWDAVFGTVTLGKFFLGFGSIGICEHAMAEAFDHMRRRVLYRRPVLDMPHIRLAAAQAYARLAAMRLYAYRALDYVQAATAAHRRYLLYCAVQKAKVSTEGVRVVAQLSECLGARGFESETYFASALRDVGLIPGLEGSTHINIGQSAEFTGRYFDRARPARDGASWTFPPSRCLGTAPAGENPYLLVARSGRLRSVTFPGFLAAYRPFARLANVRRFARQAVAFARVVRLPAAPSAEVDLAQADPAGPPPAPDLRTTLCLGQCLATIAYGQLIAENAALAATPAPVVSAIFHLLVADLGAAGIALAAVPGANSALRAAAAALVAIPATSASDWDRVADRFNTLEGG